METRVDSKNGESLNNWFEEEICKIVNSFVNWSLTLGSYLGSKDSPLSQGFRVSVNKPKKFPRLQRLESAHIHYSSILNVKEMSPVQGQSLMDHEQAAFRAYGWFDFKTVTSNFRSMCETASLDQICAHWYPLCTACSMKLGANLADPIPGHPDTYPPWGRSEERSLATQEEAGIEPLETGINSFQPENLDNANLFSIGGERMGERNNIPAFNLLREGGQEPGHLTPVRQSCASMSLLRSPSGRRQQQGPLREGGDTQVCDLRTVCDGTGKSQIF
ncbi:hypothetical protein E5288_WYG019883 [Bos mutus]|uniref:Uncharacterized protein n=1 Tax=Bos mutus TaxID=72004 RepID=A0A6B0RNA6_9CETA|nr:hypothetical protein [Bos mutus]